jgi:hypothetical protein
MKMADLDNMIEEARAILDKGKVLPPALARVARVTLEIADDDEALAVAQEVLNLPDRDTMRRSLAAIHNQTRTAERALEVTRKQVEQFADETGLDPWSGDEGKAGTR